MKIYLSPSPQIHNEYAAGNTTECLQCNRIADAARIALLRCGFEVKKATEAQAMARSIAESNSWGADLHIPIHTNAGSKGRGVEVMIFDTDSANLLPAKALYDALLEKVPGDGRGIRVRPDLAELNSTKATAVYLECEFHDKPDLARWIIDHVIDLGEAIAKGVCSFAGVKYISPMPLSLDTKSKNLRPGELYTVLAYTFTQPKVTVTGADIIAVQDPRLDAKKRGYLIDVKGKKAGFSHITVSDGTTSCQCNFNVKG